MSHSTVAHRWAHQIGNLRTNENAFESGNMFYRNKIIYSYGRHYAIGIRFDDVVIINSAGYSPSTGKHTSIVWSSIDASTHDVLRVPLKEAYNFWNDMDFKEAYKCIDFKSFVYDFDHNIKKLGNARKPEKYTSEIEYLKNKLEKIFSMWRGAKTLALKTKGIRSILNFEFTTEMQKRLKRAREIELEKQRKRKQAQKKEAFENLLDYERGDHLSWDTLSILDLNTVIRVKGDIIETSKHVKIDLSEGIRMFKIWNAGKAIGSEIKSKDGVMWKCTKANGVIKFGCHEVDFKQAKRVLTPYLD